MVIDSVALTPTNRNVGSSGPHLHPFHFRDGQLKRESHASVIMPKKLSLKVDMHCIIGIDKEKL